MRRLTLGVLCLSCLISASGRAAEIKGKVRSVSGTVVEIELEGDLLPNVGDEVEVFGEVPGLGPVPLTGTWKVISVRDGTVTADTKDESPGTPQTGYAVTIQSENPRAESETGEPAESAAPDKSFVEPVGPRVSDEDDDEVERWGWIGVNIQDTLEGKGPIIVSVVSDGPADQGGLMARDVILTVNGLKTKNVAVLQEILNALPPGTIASVKVQRGNRTTTVNVTVGAMDKAEQFNRMGFQYYSGTDVEKDLSLAVKWYEKAARLGHPLAQNMLGWLCEHGQGTEADEERAFHWYQQSAENGNSVAQSNLGIMYQNGRGVEQDMSKAFYWFKNSADKGNSAGQSNLGWLYQSGQGVDKDLEEAFGWYEKSADQGNTDGMNNLGRAYYNGWGVKRDAAKGVELLRKASDLGHTWATYNLANAYYNGQGVRKDHKTAFKYFLKSAETGHTDSEDMVGVMYSKGQGTEKDYAAALLWFRKAAEKGFPNAQNNLGVMYENGWGVGKNDTEAFKWYQLAAKQGNTFAQENLRKRARQ